MTNVLIFLTLSLLILSCERTGKGVPNTNPVEPPTDQVYAPGQVGVGFVDTVNYAFIASFIRSLGLEAIDINADSAFSMWMRVDSGNVNELIARLQQDTAVAWAQQCGYEGGDPQKAYILAFFRGTVDTTYALQFVESIEGINWQQTIHPPRTALIKVPAGQEIGWVAHLETYSFVRWADLNYIVHIATN